MSATSISISRRGPKAASAAAGRQSSLEYRPEGGAAAGVALLVGGRHVRYMGRRQQAALVHELESFWSCRRTELAGRDQRLLTRLQEADEPDRGAGRPGVRRNGRDDLVGVAARD